MVKGSGRQSRSSGRKKAVTCPGMNENSTKQVEDNADEQNGLGDEVNKQKSRRSMGAKTLQSPNRKRKTKEPLTEEIVPPKRQGRNEKNKSNNAEVVTATVQEDGDILEYEVAGQSTEFCSEEENEGKITSDSEDEEVTLQKTTSSKNSSRPKKAIAATQEEKEEELPEELVHIIRKTPEEIRQEEEEEMQKFVDFMRKKGLMIVEASSQVMKTPGKTGQTGKSKPCIPMIMLIITMHNPK